MKPTLSIIMPVFNRPSELKVMVDSIIANSYSDWELLAVDDGSDDTTLSILNAYAEQDERIRIITRTRLPKGAQTCRNIGFAQSRGKYVIFADSDDFMASYCLESRVREIENHPELDFMVFPSGVYSDGISLQPHLYMYGYPVYKDTIAAFSRRTLPFIVWNNIYRADALRAKDLVWDEHLLSMQDSDFNLMTLLAGLRFDYARNVAPDYAYRLPVQSHQSNSISGQMFQSEAYRESQLYLIEKFYRSIQAQYGHLYDNQLYDGILTFHVRISSTESDTRFLNQVGVIIKRYSPCCWRIFKVQMCLYKFFAYFLPHHMARNIPITTYLIRRKYWDNFKCRIIANSITSNQ